jgi:hypothetical protein
VEALISINLELAEVINCSDKISENNSALFGEQYKPSDRRMDYNLDPEFNPWENRG